MAKHFANTTGETLTATGWGSANEYNNHRIPKIVDTVAGGLALDKMGTSIPHPFARLFVFNTAFDEVNSPKHGQADNSTSYAKLVSECLDLLEFIYLYGSQIQVKRWNLDDLKALKESNYAGHQKLAKALDHAIGNLSYKDAGGNQIPFDTIYLFFYNGALLGGTSPYTLVFTSPNIRKNLKQVNANGFRGLNGNELFQDYSLEKTKAIHLKDRAPEFQQFLSEFYFAYQNIMNNTSIGVYIYNNRTEPAISAYWNKLQGDAQATVAANFNAKYDTLSFDIEHVKNQINILGNNVNQFIPLGYRKPDKVNNVVDTDYEMVPTVEVPEGKVIPLALNTAGLTGAKLVNGQPMPGGIDLKTSEAVENRTLPTGHNIKYPYVYADDFLEDKLIEMPYKVNGEDFLPMTCGGKNFLIPLKGKFFEYFRPQDVAKMLTIEPQGADYLLRLSIPVKFNNQKIDLTKSIKQQQVMNLNDGAHFLGMALYPSYRIMNEDLNQYKLMLNAAECKASTRFFVKDTEVTAERKEQGDFTYYNLRGAFDRIEITVGDAKALIIPKFKEVNLISRSDIAVGIDFGTSNSFVCVKDGASNPVALSITHAERQVLTLNEYDLSKGNKGAAYRNSMTPNGMDDFYYEFIRMFIPHVLGTKDSVASFPYPSVTCEKQTFKSNADAADLSSDLAIGLNYTDESISAPNYSYTSNIKWLLNTNNPADTLPNQQRVELFIKEIAWMVKNYIMLRPNPTKTFTVFITFPGSMSKSERGDITDMWKGAFDSLLGAGNVKIDDNISESIAPFLYLLGHHGAIANNYVNIDIGGGTTDILYIDAENKKMFADSNKFAGNDLWGDGVEKDITKFNNGFLKLMENLIEQGIIKLDEDQKARFATQKGLAKTSADVMGYIFRNEDKFLPKTHIKVNDTLKAVLATHIAAICYHVGRTMQAQGMSAKNLEVNFSGMGSKYLDILLTSPQLKADFIEIMLNQLGFDEVSVKIADNMHVSPKEITAVGAVISQRQSVRDLLSEYTGPKLQPKQVSLNLGELTPITYGSIDTRKEDILKEFKTFVNEYLMGEGLVKFLKKESKLRFTPEFINKLTDFNATSLGIVKALDDLKEIKDEDVEESSFFWPFKEALVNASNA